MALTLAEYQRSTQDAIQKGVIEEFRKASYLMDKLHFDRAVAPVGNGTTLTYGYLREKTLAPAGFRGINEEYVASESETEQVTVHLKIFGGKAKIDRVLSHDGGIYNEMEFQIKSKVKSAVALFNDTFINGDTGTNAKAFDGIDVAVAGSATDFSRSIDLSTSAAIDANYKAFLDAMDDFLALLKGKPSALFMNKTMKAKMKAVARRAGYYTRSEDAFGRPIDEFDGIALEDLGEKQGSADPVVTINAANGNTAIYAGILEPNGAINAVTLNDGKDFIKHYLPDLDSPGAVKDLEIEAVAAIALKATKAAGVFRGIKVR